MSRSGWVMPRASHRAPISEISPATAPASRNCHHTLCRNPSVAEMRPRGPRRKAGCIAVTYPPLSSGTVAQVMFPTTPHLGTAPQDRGVAGDVRELADRRLPRERERVDRLAVARAVAQREADRDIADQ